MSDSQNDLFAAMVALPRLDEAWAKVRANGGCAGGDGETIEGFGRRAARRLMMLATSLESGKYRPSDLRVLYIPKASGGKRPLAIPSVQDRVAQTACAAMLTPSSIRPSARRVSPTGLAGRFSWLSGRWSDGGRPAIIMSSISVPPANGVTGGPQSRPPSRRSRRRRSPSPKAAP